MQKFVMSKLIRRRQLILSWLCRDKLGTFRDLYFYVKYQAQDTVLPHFQTPRNELKIQSAVEYF